MNSSNSMFHIRGLTIDLMVIVTFLAGLPFVRPVLLFLIDPHWLPVVGTIGAVVVGRVLDWSYKAYRRHRNTQKKKREGV
jgi:hypothetical protein